MMMLNTLLCLFLSFGTFAKAPAVPEPPRRLLFMVFDQMRPDYIERFDLKNFKRLRSMGTFYREAYVGHMGSLTIVSHPVMTTGLLPKFLPWADNLVWDRTGVSGEKGKVQNVLQQKSEALLKALSTLPSDVFFIKRFKDKTHRKVFAVGEKHYSTTTMAGPFTDSLIFMNAEKGICHPTGHDIPEFITANKRFEVDCQNPYGTENSFYGLDGNHFYPGKDLAHLGGDIWVADVALEVMKNEKDWGALFLTFGAIDKFGHMLGSPDGEVPLAFTSPASLKEIAQIADQQLGRLLDQLEKENLLSSTLIVSTADHGAQTDQFYLGTGNLKGDAEPFWIDRLAKMGKIRFTEQDTAIRVWLSDDGDESRQKALAVLREVSKVTRIFALDRSAHPLRYKEVFANLKNESPAFQKWANAHDQELVDTIANDRAPDLVAALADGVGFGKLGDHGGFQEKVQRIPLFIVGPGFKKSISHEPRRLVDIEPMLSKAFQLTPKPTLQ